MTLGKYRTRIEEVMRLKCPHKAILEDTKQLRPWKLKAERETEIAFQYAYMVPPGYSAEDLEKQQDALAASCGKVIEIENRAGIVVVDVYKEDFPALLPYDPTMLTHIPAGKVLLGYTRKKEPIVKDFTRQPHMGLCGKSGYGKTDLLRFILGQLIWSLPPDQLEIWIVDMKQVSFFPFMDLPNVKVATNEGQAVEFIGRCYQEVLDRFETIFKRRKRSLAATYPLRLLVIDEAAEISHNDAVMEMLNSITRLGRETKIGVLFCTQYPTADVLPRQTKTNLEYLVSLHVSDQTASLVALDHIGAEQLPSPGRAMVNMPGRELVEFLVPFVGSDEKWEELLSAYYAEEGSHDTERREPGEDTDFIP